MKKYSLDKTKVVLFVVDVQERLLPAITEAERVETNIGKLLDAAAVFSLPTIITEQYPKGLGPTTALVKEKARAVNAQYFEKTTFTALTEDVVQALQKMKRTDILLCGTETHICVLATARDLLAQGFCVHVVYDAVGSRNIEHKKVAIKTMRDMGAVVSAYETVLYELVKDSRAAEFKAIAQLVR